jgi:hypothetical protein
VDCGLQAHTKLNKCLIQVVPQANDGLSTLYPQEGGRRHSLGSTFTV